ncbi:MAG TPA: hypothetical protein VMS75_04860 [Terriglobales bacterium]|nr:hypothetical protein [Terriglobales bacterium]
MEKTMPVRWGWLRAMYLWTTIGAGGFGFAMLVFPQAVQSILRFPPQDQVVFKLYGSVLFAAGLIAIPALRAPLKFLALLLLQVVYKPVWVAVVAIPMFLKGQFPLYVVAITAIFLTYIIGDLIAIPFSYLFSKS